jgi:tRNA-guanine family transglycosylase
MFTMIYNFGGGGSDVYRVSSYLDLFKEIPIMMMNWYYLTGGGTFKVKWVEYLDGFKDIFDYLKFIQEEFLKQGMVKQGYQKLSIDWRPIMMLDSGSGNIVRDLLESSLEDHVVVKRFLEMISDYVQFSKKLSFDIMIALDFSRKYTYKKGESESEYYQRMSKELASDIENNLKLLSEFLLCIKSIDDHQGLPMIYAPLRGFTREQYVKCLKKVLELEEKIGEKFDGFAIAGLGEYRRKDTFLFISSVSKAIREHLNELHDYRPLHVLAVGGIQKIIPLTLGGADTFDCMTPWRRATDGNMSDAIKVFDANVEGSFSKYLIPLLNSKLEIIKENSKDVWKYIDLPKVSNDITCECEVCKNFQIKELKELYSHGHEDYYFARVLLFMHALLQHIYLCRRISKDTEEDNPIIQLITEIPDEELKREYFGVVTNLKSF